MVSFGGPSLSLLGILRRFALMRFGSSCEVSGVPLAIAYGQRSLQVTNVIFSLRLFALIVLILPPPALYLFFLLLVAILEQSPRHVSIFLNWGRCLFFSVQFISRLRYVFYRFVRMNLILHSLSPFCAKAAFSRGLDEATSLLIS